MTGVAETALRFSPDAIVVNSFSKYYCMTGWRIGWMVLPEPLVRPVERIAQNLYISPPEISQLAAIAAFDATPELEAIKAGYAENRRILLDRLPTIGFDEFHPVDGAFYVYASVRRFSNDFVEFTRRMLAEAGVAATPGPDFDRARGHDWMRFSFAGTDARHGRGDGAAGGVVAVAALRVGDYSPGCGCLRGRVRKQRPEADHEQDRRNTKQRVRFKKGRFREPSEGRPRDRCKATPIKIQQKDCEYERAIQRFRSGSQAVSDRDERRHAACDYCPGG